MSLEYFYLSKNTETFAGECPSIRHIISSRAASLPSGMIQSTGYRIFYSQKSRSKFYLNMP